MIFRDTACPRAADGLAGPILYYSRSTDGSRQATKWADGLVENRTAESPTLPAKRTTYARKCTKSVPIPGLLELFLCPFGYATQTMQMPNKNQCFQWYPRFHLVKTGKAENVLYRIRNPMLYPTELQARFCPDHTKPRRAFQSLLPAPVGLFKTHEFRFRHRLRLVSARGGIRAP